MPRRNNLPDTTPDATGIIRSKLDRSFMEDIELYGDPRVQLMRLAERAEAEEDFATAARCWSEIAQYVAPKLRAMEVQANIQSTQVVFNIDLGEEEETVDVSPDE